MCFLQSGVEHRIELGSRAQETVGSSRVKVSVVVHHYEAVLGRLGVKARAAGIYLIFAAQRPDANVVPVQLRSQLGNRLILKVDSEGTSEIALGERGAERLLGRGHLLARLEGEADLVYAQAPFASDAFIAEVVAAITSEHAGAG